MSSEADLEFWRTKCSRLEARNAELEAQNGALKQDLQAQSEEFADFESSSKLLETELEKQCEQLEKKVNELTSQLSRLEHERERGESGVQESRKTIQRLESTLESVVSERDDLRKSIRELEQSNDDLERAKRNALCSLEDLEKGMNDMIERNALLENEVDEAESLKSQYQRLRDEARELKEELSVQEKKKPAPSGSSIPPPSRLRASTGRGAEEPMDTSVASPARTGIPRSMTVDCGSPITPGSRVSAMNIVGDLLRKVGALESKLQSARMKCPASSAPDEGSPRGPQAKLPHLAQPGPPSRLPLPKTSPPKLAKH